MTKDTPATQEIPRVFEALYQEPELGTKEKYFSSYTTGWGDDKEFVVSLSPPHWSSTDSSWLVTICKMDGILSDCFPIIYLENDPAVYSHCHGVGPQRADVAPQVCVPDTQTEFSEKAVQLMCEAGERMVTGKPLGAALSVGLWSPLRTPWAATFLIPSVLPPTGKESSNSSASLNLTVSIIPPHPCAPLFCSPTPDSDLAFAYLFSFAHRLCSLGPDSQVPPTQKTKERMLLMTSKKKDICKCKGKVVELVILVLGRFSIDFRKLL